MTLALYGLGAGADRYELEVDHERGVLLACRAFCADKPLQTVTAETMTFDEPLAAELFAVDSEIP